MSNIVFFIVFITLVSAIWLGGHYYLAMRINAAILLKSSNWIHMSIRVAIFAGALLFLISEILSRNHILVKPGAAGTLLRLITSLGIVWAGIFSIGITLFLIRDILLLFTGNSIKLYIVSGYVSIALIIIISVFSTWRGTQQPITKEYILLSEKLLDGRSFTIIQLSDLHINYGKSASKWLGQIVAKVNAENPDIVVITGDITDVGDLTENGKEYIAAFKNIKTRLGVYAVSGNHEYYAGYENFRAFASEAGITILENENILIPLRKDEGGNSVEEKIIFVGLPDDESARFRGKNSAPDFEKATKNTAIGKNYSVLLYHRPSGFSKHHLAGIDLQLSGHLHAGQIPPMDLIIYLAFRYPYGLYRRKNSCLYTTSGASTWGPPMRLFSKNEIAKFIIKGKAH